jgi:hypothetical protein
MKALYEQRASIEQARQDEEALDLDEDSTPPRNATAKLRAKKQAQAS